MKIARGLGFLFAIVFHVGVLLFGGLLFLSKKADHGTLAVVDLVDGDSAEKEKEKRDEPKVEKKEELETSDEKPPDAADLMKALDPSAAADAPALEPASLGAIDALLSGLSGDGEFDDALTLTYNGRINGTGMARALDDTLENAFGLGEIDQKPRAVFQTTPLYPTEMRGKKLEGVVSVIFVVDSSGKVAAPRVEKASHPAFEKPALDAVKQWKFEPAIKAGQRVGCKMRVPIRFQPN